MLFIRYENWKDYLRYYPVTSLILAINIALFIAMTLQGGSDNTGTLLKFGAFVNEAPYVGQYWRYVASCFLHIGFEHLLFNCFSILVFAPPLERLLGKAQFAIYYLASGFAGNIATVLLAKEAHLSAGASGAIYGIYAAFIYLGVFRRHLLDQASRKVIYSVVAIGAIYSIIMPHISLTGHFGGFVGGFIMFRFMKMRIAS